MRPMCVGKRAPPVRKRPSRCASYCDDHNTYQGEGEGEGEGEGGSEGEITIKGWRGAVERYRLLWQIQPIW